MFGALCINVSEELLRTISSHLPAWLEECDGNYAKKKSSCNCARKQLVTVGLPLAPTRGAFSCFFADRLF